MSHCITVSIISPKFHFGNRENSSAHARILSEILPQLAHGADTVNHYYDHDTTVEENKYASGTNKLTADQEPYFVVRKESMLLPTQEDSLVGDKEDMIMAEHTDILTPEEDNTIRSLVVTEAPAPTTEAKLAVSENALLASAEAKEAVSDKILPRVTVTAKTTARTKKRAETARQRTSRVCYEANQMAGE